MTDGGNSKLEEITNIIEGQGIEKFNPPINRKTSQISSVNVYIQYFRPINLIKKL